MNIGYFWWVSFAPSPCAPGCGRLPLLPLAL